MRAERAPVLCSRQNWPRIADDDAGIRALAGETGVGRMPAAQGTVQTWGHRGTKDKSREEEAERTKDFFLVGQNRVLKILWDARESWALISGGIKESPSIILGINTELGLGGVFGSYL